MTAKQAKRHSFLINKACNSLSDQLAQTFKGKVTNLQFSSISLDHFFNQWEIVAQEKRLNFLLLRSTELVEFLEVNY